MNCLYKVKLLRIGGRTATGECTELPIAGTPFFMWTQQRNGMKIKRTEDVICREDDGLSSILFRTNEHTYVLTIKEKTQVLVKKKRRTKISTDQ